MLGLVAGIFDANTVVLFVPDARGSEEPETSRLAAYCSAGDNVIPDVRIAPGQGLVGWILRSRKPLLVPEFDGEHSNLDYYREGGEAAVRSFIGCPLPTGGALCADTSRNHPFTEKDHHILQMCADMIDSIRRRKGAEAIVSEIPGYYLQLGIIEDLRFRFRQWQVYIKNFLLAVAEATGFDYCSFASVNVPGESYCIESENRPRLVQGNEPFFQSMANGLAGWVFRNGQPVVQTGEDGRVPTLFGNSENLPEFSAVICMPVMVNKSTRGVICLGHSQPHAVDALASENKILSHPASVDSIPSCENQEDFVSMGTTAARKAAEILKNSRRIIATEIMAACQALDLKPENQELGKGTKPAYDMIRSKVAFIEFDKDIEIFEELNKASAVVESEEFLATIEKAVDLSIQY